MPRPSIFHVLMIALILVVGSVSAASAQNILTNPGFATDLSGWPSPVSFITAVWQDVDATGQSGSGSALVTNSFPKLTNGIAQCVAISGGRSYDLGARASIPAAETAASAEVNVSWFATANCDGATLSVVETPALASTSGEFVGISKTGVVAPAEAVSASFAVVVSNEGSSGSATVAFDDLYFQQSGGCTPEATHLCLSGGRFKVEGTWATATASGQAQAVTLTSDTGYLWFFNPKNVELVVKVLNGCEVDKHYWVFAGGLTNVAVNLVVTDTSTGVQKMYDSNRGPAFAPIQDSAAFAACP